MDISPSLTLGPCFPTEWARPQVHFSIRREPRGSWSYDLSYKTMVSWWVPFTGSSRHVGSQRRMTCTIAFKNLPQWVQQQTVYSRLNLSGDSMTTVQQPGKTGKERMSTRLLPAQLPCQQQVPWSSLSLGESCPRAHLDTVRRSQVWDELAFWDCWRNSC